MKTPRMRTTPVQQKLLLGRLSPVHLELWSPRLLLEMRKPSRYKSSTARPRETGARRGKFPRSTWPTGRLLLDPCRPAGLERWPVPKVAPRNAKAFAVQEFHRSTRRDRHQAREVSEEHVAYKKVALGSLAPCRARALARPKGCP